MKKFTLLLFFWVSLASPLTANSRQENFSLVISGGISLGAYEAGYNWALLKYMTYLKYYSTRTDIDMKSIAGASAGAINTLMSTLAWCRSKESLDVNNTIDDNLFYQMWTEVDFEDLLIDKNGVQDPDNTTSLFSRRKIEKQAQKIVKEMHRPLYDRECRVPFGFAVTRVEPKRVTISGISLDNKLFHIPLRFETDGQGRGMVYDDRVLQRSNIIHLSQAGRVSDDALKKAMFASSAFPIAFEQVDLTYWYKGVQEEALFLDGGVFDNVPLDLAIRLAGSQSSDYIFMDPKNTRRKYLPLGVRKLETPQSSPTNTAIELLFDIFSASESSLLYNTLSEHFGSNSRKIHLSDRYFPITGMLLEHFGAFLDHGFREYDYYIGVYDAMINSAKYVCGEDNDACFQRAKETIYKILVKDSPRAEGFLNFLSREEFGAPFVPGKYKVDSDFMKIYEALKGVSIYDMQDFHTFIEKLKSSGYRAHNPYLRHALDYPDEWYRQTLASIVQRVVMLERKNSKNLSKTITAVAAYTAGSFYRHKSGYVYNPVSAPLDQDKLWVKMLPYEVAVGKNMLSLGYENYYFFDHNKWYLPRALELKPSVSLEITDRKNQVSFLRLDANLNFEPKRDIVSLGFGVSAFRDLDNRIDKEIDFGGNFYVDLLNMVRITATRRGDYRGQDWYIYAGINDIPSFVYWLFTE